MPASILGALAAACLLATGCTSSDEEPQTCTYLGKTFEDGDVFPAGDGCNSCACNPGGDTPGEFECSLIDCCPAEICSIETQCTGAPPAGVQQCPEDCGTTCGGSCAEVCGLTCASCVPVADDQFDWVVFAIDCNCAP